MKITFAVASHGDGAILRDNFLASPCFAGHHPHQILVKENYESAATAYNQAINQATNELIVFAHFDVIFPASWLSQLADALKALEQSDPTWGVLGCYGMTTKGEGRGWVFQSGRGQLGESFGCPVPVQTLDEIVLVTRKSSGLRFDERLQHFHLYGTDICLRASALGMTSYAISAFCVHNTNNYLVLPKEFYACYRHVRSAWWHSLPLHTTCITIAKSKRNYYLRRLNEARLKWISRRAFIAPRSGNTPGLMAEAERGLVTPRLSGIRILDVSR